MIIQASKNFILLPLAPYFDSLHNFLQTLSRVGLGPKLNPWLGWSIGMNLKPLSHPWSQEHLSPSLATYVWISHIVLKLESQVGATSRSFPDIAIAIDYHLHTILSMQMAP